MKRTLIFLVIAVICLSGCENKVNKEKITTIIGTWAHGSFIYTFNEDKTCSYDAYGTTTKCTYEIDGNKLSILYEGNDESFETTYTIKNNTLNIKDSFGANTPYTRK